MKNKFKIVIAALVLAGLSSCTDEKDIKYLEAKGDFQIITPESATGIVLTPELETNPAITLSWEAADFTTPTAVAYTIEMAETGNDFVDIIVAGSTNVKNITWSVADLNGAAVGAGLIPFSEGSVDVRIKASAGGQDQYSNVINLLITPYSTDLPKIAVPGNHQGWNPPTAPTLAASAFGETDYEGFVWLDGEYKFLAPDGSGNFNWGADDWGDDGSFSGVLALTGESNCISGTGYYRVKANTTTLTYSTDATAWGIIGAATPLGWDNSTALTYNPTTKKWEGTVTLSAGEFKFRANNAWTINLGGDPDADGSMNYDGPNLSVATAGTYNVALDLSNPRKYSYTLN
jgi:starch-binding outer membrane protein SusE/F